MSTNLNGEEETIDDGHDTVLAITKANDPKRRKRRTLMKIIGFIFLVIVAGLIITFTYYSFIHYSCEHNTSPASDWSTDSLESYIFPNTSLSISVDTEISLKGGFIVDDIHYEFSADFHSLSLIEVSSEPMGFTVKDNNESNPEFVLEFLARNGSIFSTKVTPSTPANMTVVNMLMQSVLVQHFIELSAKLGGAGYLGSHGQHLEDLHRFAQWMYKYETKLMDYDDLNSYELWDNMTAEFEKVNAIVFASANAGHWVKSMDELVSYTSKEYTPSRGGSVGSGRGLLGNCGSVYSQCDNECFGGCGNNCNCWSWVCGDCDCWLGCEAHDHYCSCGMLGILEYCCVNVFWVHCDGSGTCG